jgi:hypothetical protein
MPMLPIAIRIKENLIYQSPYLKQKIKSVIKRTNLITNKMTFKSRGF